MTQSRVAAFGSDDISDELNLATLSERELQILERAIDGLTDQQIGNAINISPSTVNSYWVRIRGKLGHLSRTDLVSRILRQRALRENEILRARISDLERQLATSQQSEWNGENAELLRIAFEAHPDPVLILDERSSIIMASRQACLFFGYPPAQIIGLCLSDLVMANRRSHGHAGPFSLQALESLGKLGLEYAVFARTKSGALIRVFLLLQSADFKDSRIGTCVIRPFTEEIQIRQAQAAVMLMDAS